MQRDRNHKYIMQSRLYARAQSIFPFSLPHPVYFVVIWYILVLKYQYVCTSEAL
jgi:hypothetical protein